MLHINYMRSGSGHDEHSKHIKISIFDNKGNVLITGNVNDTFSFSVGSNESFSIQVDYGAKIDKMADIVIQGIGTATKQVVNNDYSK